MTVGSCSARVARSQEQEERELTVRSILLRDGQVLARKGSPRSYNVATLPDSLPTVIKSLVVHGYSATVVRLLGAIDSSAVYNRGR